MKQNVLITGASGGLGLELAKIYAKKGDNLILVSSNMKKLKNAKRQLELEKGSRVYLIALDLSQPESAQKIMDKIDIDIDLLINNAGRGYIGEADMENINSLEKQIQLNVTTPAILSRMVLKKMKSKKQGKILNICSIGSFTPGPYTASYYASKSYLLSETLALRQEAAKYNIQVCAFCPGTMKTDFFTKAEAKTPLFAQNPAQAAVTACLGLNQNQAVIFSSMTQRLSLMIPVKFRQNIIAMMKQPKENSGNLQ